MRFATDKALASIPALEGMSPEEATAAFQTAGRVYRYIRSNEFIEESELRDYGERNGISPDDMNVSIAILQDRGMLFGLPDNTPIEPQEPADAEAPA